MTASTPNMPRANEPTIDHSMDNELEAPPMGTDDSAAQSLDNPSHMQGEAATETETPAATTETPAETATPPAASGTEGEQAAAVAQAGEEEAAAASQEFTTDFKYKVRDEEHTIEEWAQPFIKDEETFKKFQDLHTRGHGLELAKQERDEFKSKYDAIDQSLNIVNGFVQQYYKDPTNPENGAKAAQQFIESLGLPKQMFLQYAIGELKYQQLPPEQKAVVDQQRQYEQQVQQAQYQNQTLQQQNTQLAVQQHTMALDTTLADPNVASMMNDYDSRVGTPGAFRDFVVQRGIFHEQVNNVIKPAQEVVNEVVQLLGLTPQGTGTQTVPPGTQVQQTPQQQVPTLQQQMVAQQQKPTLPNISGQGSASPVKRTINSIEDIRARYNELNAQA